MSLTVNVGIILFLLTSNTVVLLPSLYLLFPAYTTLTVWLPAVRLATVRVIGCLLNSYETPSTYTYVVPLASAGKPTLMIAVWPTKTSVALIVIVALCLVTLKLVKLVLPLKLISPLYTPYTVYTPPCILVIFTWAVLFFNVTIYILLSTNKYT